MKDMFGEFKPFPEKALKQGESWEQRRTTEAPGIGKMTIVEALTLRGIENGIARIGVTRTVENNVVNIGPIGMRIEYTSNDGELLFDLSKGRLQRSTSNTAQNMIMSFTPPAGAPPGLVPAPGPMKSTSRRRWQ